MKKPIYTIASIITILLISERALDVFFDVGPFAPKSVKLLFVVYNEKALGIFHKETERLFKVRPLSVRRITEFLRRPVKPRLQ